MIGDINPLPFQVGGGPSRVESYFNAFKSIVGINGHSKDDFSLEAEWRKSRALALAALATFDERAMLQAFPHKATDHLELFEKLHAIESDPTKSNEQRRALIVPNHIATPESWWLALTAQLQLIDTRITMRIVEHEHESTTVVGKALRSDPDIGASYGRSCTSYPNVSTSFTVFVLFNTGGGVPTLSDLSKRSAIAELLTSALPSWCDWRINFATGFILDVSLLDITAFGPRKSGDLTGVGNTGVTASGSLEIVEIPFIDDVLWHYNPRDIVSSPVDAWPPAIGTVTPLAGGAARPLWDGSSVEFDGVDDQFTVATSTGIHPQGATELTVGVWLKLDNHLAGDVIVTGAYGTGIWFRITPTFFDLISTGQVTRSITTLPVGDWIFVAATWKASRPISPLVYPFTTRVRFFLGAPTVVEIAPAFDNNDNATAIPATTGTAYIGGTGSSQVNGKHGNMILWDRELEAPELQAFVNATNF